MTPPPVPPAGVAQLQDVLQRIISLSIGLALVAVTVMLVVGGIKFLTSGGEPKAISSASGTLTWALLGVFFLALIWLVLKLIEAFTGVPVTQVCLGFPGASTECQNSIFWSAP